MSTKPYQLTLGYSPCPNDTFIFYALAAGLVSSERIDFQIELADVQELNQWAMRDKLDVSKISYGVLPLLTDRYDLLSAGGALGMGVGPLLIARDVDMLQQIGQLPVAIPGEQTTAHILFSLAFPEWTNKRFIRYDQIEDFVASGQGFGVIIHENRFTYADKGLVLAKDLGAHWEQTTGAPIPLGGIVIRESIPPEIKFEVNQLIQASLRYAWAHVQDALPGYIRCNAQEMSEEVMWKHIHLYVNQFSEQIDSKGLEGIKKLFDVYSQLHQKPVSQPRIVAAPH